MCSSAVVRLLLLTSKQHFRAIPSWPNGSHAIGAREGRTNEAKAIKMASGFCQGTKCNAPSQNAEWHNILASHAQNLTEFFYTKLYLSEAKTFCFCKLCFAPARTFFSLFLASFFLFSNIDHLFTHPFSHSQQPLFLPRPLTNLFPQIR